MFVIMAMAPNLYPKVEKPGCRASYRVWRQILVCASLSLLHSPLYVCAVIHFRHSLKVYLNFVT